MAIVKLTATPGGIGDCVEIDGHDIADGLSGYSLHARAGHMPQLTVELHIADSADARADVDLVIPEATTAALIALGWTPPPGDRPAT